MRVVTVRAITRRSRVLHLGFFDLLCLLAVTGYAQVFDLGLGQYYFSVFGRRMAHLAALVSKRRMKESGQEFRGGRLVRVVALQAVRCTEGLILVRLLQGGIFRIMAVDAECRGPLRQVKAVFSCGFRSRLVGHVAGLATHIQSGMTAALFRDIESLRVASEAEIVFLVARGGPEQLVLVFRCMRVVAFQAVPDRRFMDLTFDHGGVLVAVTCEAKLVRGGGDQLHACDVFIDPNLMAGQTPHGDRRMNRLALAFFAMTFHAFR